MTVTLRSKVSGPFDATLYTSTDSTYVFEWNGKYYRVGSAGSLTIIDNVDKSKLTKSPNFSNRLKVYQQDGMVYFVDGEQIYKIEVTTTTNNNGTLNTESSIVAVPSNLSPTNTSSLSGGSVDLSTAKLDLNGTVTVYTPTTPALGTQNDNTIYLATNNKIIYSYNPETDSIIDIGTSLPAGVAVTQAFPGTSFQVISNTDGRRYLYANGTVYEPDFQNGSLVLVQKTTTNETNGTLGGINNISSSILNTIGGGLGDNTLTLNEGNSPLVQVLAGAELLGKDKTIPQQILGGMLALAGVGGLIKGLINPDNNDGTTPLSSDPLIEVNNPLIEVNNSTLYIGSSGSDLLTDGTTTEPSGEIGYAIETVNPDGSVTATKVPASDPRVQEFLKSQNNNTSSSASEPTSEQNLTGAPAPATVPQQSSSQKTPESSQKTKDTPDKPSATSDNKEPKKQTIASAPVESTQKEKSQSIPTDPPTNKKPEQRSASDGANSNRSIVVKGTKTTVNKNIANVQLVFDMKDRENPLEVHFTLDGKELIANQFKIEKDNIVIDAGTKVTIPLTKLSMVNLAALGDKLEDKYIVQQGDQHFTLTKPTNALSSYKLTATGSKPALVGGNKRFDIDGDGKAENTDPINLKWAMNQTSTGGGGNNKNEKSATVSPTEKPTKEQNQITSIYTGAVSSGKFHWAYIDNELKLVSPTNKPVDYLVKDGKIYVKGKDGNENVANVAIELTHENYVWDLPEELRKKAIDQGKVEVRFAGTGNNVTLYSKNVPTGFFKPGEYDGDNNSKYTGVPESTNFKTLKNISNVDVTVSSAANLTNALAGNPLGIRFASLSGTSTGTINNDANQLASV